MQRDPDVWRLATILTQIQHKGHQRVRVPRPIAGAARELEQVHSLARLVMAGDHQAERVFVAQIGGVTPRVRPMTSGTLTVRGAGLLGVVAAAPIADGTCGIRVQRNINIMQAALKLDVRAAHRDARLSVRAAEYIQQRRAQLRVFERTLLSSRPITLKGRDAGNIGAGLYEPVGKQRGLPITRLVDLASLPIAPNFAGDVPLIPPDSYLPDPPEPSLPEEDLCRELGDLCIDLFKEYAAVTLADDDAQLLASVEPACLCAASVDEKTEFTARPAAGRTFPPVRGDYRLFFRRIDITDRIVSWSPQSIRFTIPKDSSTGAVYLTRPLISASSGLGRVLGNILGNLSGVLELEGPAVISLITAPVIDSFRVNGSNAAEIVTEACTAITFSWTVRLDHQPAGQLLPPGSIIIIEIQDEAGAVLHRSSDEMGFWEANPPTSNKYHIVAHSALTLQPSLQPNLQPSTRRVDPANSKEPSRLAPCGQAVSNAVHVTREYHIRLQPKEPQGASIVAGRTGEFTITLSCPAPALGYDVELFSTDSATLAVPATMRIQPGETSSSVTFATQAHHHGVAIVKARLPEHVEGTLQYNVVDNLTAIVLSGGGAKGSFEVGALLYLREIWSEVTPTIICGTSVGAINGLALASSQQADGVDIIESVWLELQLPSDMYEPSSYLSQALAAAEISFNDFVNLVSEAGESGIDLSIWNFVDEAAAAGWFAAGWAIGGPLGGILGGLISLVVDSTDRIEEISSILRNANYLISLEPTRNKIANALQLVDIANSGMKMRLGSVALEDGELYYVTEKARLIRRSATQPDVDQAILNPDPLILGAMASAAIPGIFEAQQIVTDSQSMRFVDGGVREVLPSYAAVEMGAQLIFNISASTFDPPDKTDEDYGAPGSLSKIIMRAALDIQGNEVVRDELSPRGGFCDDRERVLVNPRFNVHDTLTIDPGLIRINMAYGYFRAFDGDQLRRGSINALQYVIWSLWTDDLISERVRCHTLEKRLSVWLPILHHDLEWALPEVRQHKNRIAELIVGRFRTFGPSSFPRKLLNGAIGDQGVLDWCATWERHQPAVRDQLAGVDLWQAQVLQGGIIGEDGPGRGPVRESEVQPPYPLPGDVVSGLAYR